MFPSLSPRRSHRLAAAPWLAWLCLGVLLGACERDHLLQLRDAGPAIGADASLPLDAATGWLARPFFDAQPPDDTGYDRLHAALAGQTFFGVTVYDDQRSAGYRVEFREDETFATKCLLALSCEPFGYGFSDAEGLSWELITLDGEGRGLGDLYVETRWGKYSVPFDDMAFDPLREVLTFRLGPVLGPGGLAPGARVILTVGEYDNRTLDAPTVMLGRFWEEAP